MTSEHRTDQGTTEPSKKLYEAPRIIESGRFETLAQGCTKSVPSQCLQYAGDRIRY